MHSPHVVMIRSTAGMSVEEDESAFKQPLSREVVRAEWHKSLSLDENIKLKRQRPK